MLNLKYKVIIVDVRQYYYEVKKLILGVASAMHLQSVKPIKFIYFNGNQD